MAPDSLSQPFGRLGESWGEGEKEGGRHSSPSFTLPIAAAALAAALPHGHASAGATSRAHAGLRTDLLVLQLEGRALHLELISQGVDFLLLGLNLVLIGRGVLPQRRQLGPLDHHLLAQTGSIVHELLLEIEELGALLRGYIRIHATQPTACPSGINGAKADD